MPDPRILEQRLRSCDYRSRNVHCPHKEIPANITAAKWQIADNKWTRWTVVDCPLLPAGEIWCDMICHSQLECLSEAQQNSKCQREQDKKVLSDQQRLRFSRWLQIRN